MNSRTIAVIAVCALLFVSAIDCKKVAKNEKNEKKAKEAKVKEPKVEKVVVEEVVVVPGIQTTFEEVDAHEQVAESSHSEQPAVRKNKVSPPKSLKVTSAYEQCKVECRKQRDTVQAEDYVQHLRAELAAAEQALADENEAIAAASSQQNHNESSDNAQAAH